VASGFDLLPSTRQGRAALTSGVVVFLVLDVLVVLGSELVLGLLVLLTDLVAGLVLAFLVTLPARRALERGGPANLFGFLVGLASMFVIVFLGTQTAGIPAYPTAEGGHLGTVIYGFAFGFGVTVCMLSLRSPVDSSVYRGAAVENGVGRVWLRASLVVAGVVVGLFGLLFFAFLLLEYVLGPVVRAFAA
jgi:hypothetical protein